MTTIWGHLVGAAALLLPGGNKRFNWRFKDADIYVGFMLYVHNCRAQIIINEEVILETEADEPFSSINTGGIQKDYKSPINVGLKLINPFFVPIDAGASGTIIGYE